MSNLGALLEGYRKDDFDSTDENSSSEEDGPNFNYMYEPESGYRKGGYCPIEIGQKIGKYTIQKKLGWGAFSTVWEGVDDKNNNVAIKISKSSPSCIKDTRSELRILKIVENKRKKYEKESHVATFIDHFDIKSKFGNHICLTFTVQGPSVRNILDLFHYNGLEESECAVCIKDILLGLNFIHNVCKYVHCDLKLENVLLDYDYDVNDVETWKLKLCDMGNFEPISKCKNSRSLIQTANYRCPEIILGHGFNQKADIWSLGCVAFELYTAELLFDSSEDNRREEGLHLLNIFEFFGKPSRKFCTKNSDSFNTFFRKNGHLKVGQVNPNNTFENYEREIAEPEHAMSDNLIDFIKKCCTVNPVERASVSDLFKHPFLQ